MWETSAILQGNFWEYTNEFHTFILQLCCPGAVDIEFCKDFYDGFTMDDVDNKFENYEEFFGASHNQNGDLFDDVGIDSYFDMKDNSATNSICNDDLLEEVNVVAFHISNQIKWHL